MKGDFSYIPTIFAVFITVFTVVIIAPLLSDQMLVADLQATQTSSLIQFRSHTTMAAVSSNENLMKNVSNRTVREEDYRIQETIEPLLNDLSDSYYYSLDVQKGGADWKKHVKFEKEGPIRPGRSYTTIGIASPTENRSVMRLGIGGSN